MASPLVSDPTTPAFVMLNLPLASGIGAVGADVIWGRMEKSGRYSYIGVSPNSGALRQVSPLSLIPLITPLCFEACPLAAKKNSVNATSSIG